MEVGVLESSTLLQEGLQGQAQQETQETEFAAVDHAKNQSTPSSDTSADAFNPNDDFSFEFGVIKLPVPESEIDKDFGQDYDEQYEEDWGTPLYDRLGLDPMIGQCDKPSTSQQPDVRYMVEPLPGWQMPKVKVLQNTGVAGRSPRKTSCPKNVKCPPGLTWGKTKIVNAHHQV